MSKAPIAREPRSAAARAGGRAVKALRSFLLALLISLGVGLAIGTCVRLQLERPVFYLG